MKSKAVRASLLLLHPVIFAVLPAPAAFAADEPASGGSVLVTGRADADLPDEARVEAARFDACRNALLEAAPVFVEARALTSFKTLVSHYNYTEVRGVIEEAVAVGPASSRDQVYSQRYRIKINQGDLNLELWKKKVDIKLLYEVAERPRICLAITDSDLVRGRNASPGAAPSRSHDRIITYFKKQQPDFVFKDLLLLGASPDQVSGLVAEAAKNSFDLLVYGTTRRTSTRGPAGLADGSTVDFARADRVDWEFEWRVIDVPSQETLFHVQIPEAGPAEPDDPASRYPLIDQAAAELFRQLLAHWSRSPTGRKLEVTFESSEPPDTQSLLSRLGQVEGLDFGSVQLDSQTKGKVIYTANTTGRLPEIMSSLRKVFAKDYNLESGRAGVVRLTGVKTVEITVTIKGASLSLVGRLVSQLVSTPQVQSVHRQSFENGVARLVLATRASTEEIGTLLESSGSNQLIVRGLTSSTIDAEPK